MIIKRKHKIVLKNNSKKQYLILLIFIAFFNIINSYAQQTPHYSQYMYNMQVLNPAFVGARADLSISALSRQQWVGVEGAPATQTFSISGRSHRGIGIGFSVINDKLGLAKSTNANIDLSYTIITAQHSRLALGLKGGFTFFDNNLSQGITPDNNVYASISGQSPNIGFGALYYSRKFFVGVSIPYILSTKVFETDTESIKTNYNNYFINAGTIFELSENIMFKPSTLIKHAASLPISVDINANFLYKDVIETGISYRYENSVSALFAIIINKKFRVGYTYDNNLNNFGANLSSHEIILHLDLDFKRSTRWLLHNKCYF